MRIKSIYRASGVFGAICPAAGTFTLSLLPDYFIVTLWLWLMGALFTAIHVALFRMNKVFLLQVFAHIININAAWHYLGDFNFIVIYGLTGFIGLMAALIIIRRPDLYYAAKGEASLTLRGRLFKTLEVAAVSMILAAAIIMSFNSISIVTPFMLWTFGSLILFTLAYLLNEKHLMMNNVLFLAADTLGLMHYGAEQAGYIMSILSMMLLVCLIITVCEQRRMIAKPAIL